ncbi:hypothetical protein OBBRIDRAFT_519952 [Obba rivulosa]|uniref:Nephrocystin 3-like N-terminal domain-containing protein n=1 Tax=Obba rivulosa TaxID=1052685 RepID=A0A8E2B4K8_9APHY|nr:hypothetical protein OBBRIDRAFT_519952 [Obba rivulosa]
MAAAISSAAQISVPGPQQTNIRIAVKAIQVKLNSKVRSGIKSVISHRKSTISCTVGNDTEEKSFDTNNWRDFQWNLDTVREIPSGTPLKIGWKVENSSDQPIEIVLSYEEIAMCASKGASDTTLHKHKHKRAEITVTLQSNEVPGLERSLDNASEIAGQRKSLIKRLGLSVEVLKRISAVGGAFGGFHPAVQAVFSCIDVVLKALEEQDVQNSDVLSLISEMSDMAICLSDLDQFATLTQLRSVIEEMGTLMRNAVDLVIKRDSSNSQNKIVSVFSSNDRGKIEDLKSKLARLKQKFDRGVSIQNAIATETVKARLDKLASALDDNRYLEKLNPGYHKTDPPRCLDGTRKEILSTITSWTDNFTASNVFWVHAYPGAGKSSIAFTIANQLKKAHRLGAIFAFDRKAETSPSILWRHISYNLAQEYPTCRDDIVWKVKADTLDNMTATEIFHQLVAEPLRRWGGFLTGFPRDRLPVIVIDALDECGALGSSSTQGRREILSRISEWAELHPHFKLIVTSRFEHDINHSFSTIPHRSLAIDTGNAVKPESTEDIRRYIEDGFKKMTTGDESELVNWPGEDVVDDLSKRASGIFIWAVTVLNYVAVNPSEKRLNEVRGGLLPSGDVYALYRQILESAFSGWNHDECANVVDLVGTIVAAQIPLTSDDVASLLNMGTATAKNICKRLQPVLDGGDMLRFAHQSFVDFLLGHKNQSDDGSVKEEVSCPEAFRIDLSVAHHHLTSSMFRLMNKKLRFNICNIESSFMRSDSLPPSQVDEAIDRPLSYACRFWGFHLEHSSQTRVLDSFQVGTFMREKLLYWFEALSVLGALNTAALALGCLHRRLLPDVSKKDPAAENLVILARDAMKFVRYFAPAMSQSAPHIYLSALPFSPKMSTVANMYRREFGNTIRVSYGELTDWPAEQLVIRGHEDAVLSIAFSPDGQHIVSGSHDTTIRMWDVQTGQAVAGPAVRGARRLCLVCRILARQPARCVCL